MQQLFQPQVISVPGGFASGGAASTNGFHDLVVQPEPEHSDQPHVDLQSQQQLLASAQQFMIQQQQQFQQHHRLQQQQQQQADLQQRQSQLQQLQEPIGESITIDDKSLVMQQSPGESELPTPPKKKRAHA